MYERAVEFFGEDNVDQDLFAAFAKFEEKNREVSLVYLYTYYGCVRCVKNTERWVWFNDIYIYILPIYLLMLCKM